MPSFRTPLSAVRYAATPLCVIGYASLLTAISMGTTIGQDESGMVPANSPTTSPSSTSSSSESPAPPDAINPAAAPVDSSTTPDDSQASRAQVPDFTQNPANPQPTNIPQFPLQLGNPASPYSSTTTNSQSPQLTAPNLYVTGTTNLSQISTNQALAQAFGIGGGSDFFGDSGMNYEHAPIERLRIGPIDVKAAAVVSVVGDDDLRSGNGEGKQSDLQFTITPAFLFVYGLHDGQKGYASLTYSPTINRFYHESNQDSDDQNVALNVIYPFQRLSVNLTQTYTQSSGVNTDTNSRTSQTSYLSTIGGSYEVDDRISVSSQLQYVKTSFSGNTSGGNSANNDLENNDSQNGNSGGQGSETISLNNSASYRLSEKLTGGPSLNIGMDRPEDTAKSTYEQGTLGLNYAPTEKIGLFAQGGGEIRQYEMGGGNQVNPIFSIGLGYSPFDSTSIQVNASQSTHTSTASVGQTTGGDTVVNTAIGATITQRIVQRIYVGFAFNYSHEEDQQLSGSAGSFNSGSSGSGSEDTFTYRPTISYSPTAWSSLSLYYQYLANESNEPGQSYNDNQVGLSLSAKF